MLEVKRHNQLEDPEVQAKKDAAALWCQRATEHANTYQGKPWKYLLIPDDEIAENMTLNGLAARFET